MVTSPCCIFLHGVFFCMCAFSFSSDHSNATRGGGGGGLLPYMGYIGMCSPKGYGFSAALVINRVSNLADSGHK